MSKLSQIAFFTAAGLTVSSLPAAAAVDIEKSRDAFCGHAEKIEINLASQIDAGDRPLVCDEGPTICNVRTRHLIRNIEKYNETHTSEETANMFTEADKLCHTNLVALGKRAMELRLQQLANLREQLQNSN